MPDRIRIRRQQDATILRVERPNKRTRLRVRTTSTGTGAGGGGAVDSVNGRTGTVVLGASDVGALPDDTVIPDISGLQATSEKNQPNGYAGLDGDGTIPDNRIPSSIARDTEIGTQITAHDGSGTAHATLFAGKADVSHAHGGADITSGLVAPAVLGTGGAGAGAKFLADDQTYKTVASDGVAAVISSTTFPGFAPIGPNHAPVGGSVNHGLGGLGREAYAPFFCPAGTYDAIGVGTTVAAVSTWRLGIDDNTAGWPGAVLLDAGTVNMNATAGWQVITGLTFTVAHPRWLWTHVKCVAYTASPTVRCLDGVGSASSSPRIPGWPVYGALPGRALVGAGSYINSGSAGVLTAAGPMGPNSATQVGFTQTTPLIVLRRSS